MPTLRWLTRDQDVRAAEKVPYRLLEEVPELGYGDQNAGNMLIQGDNLEALKSLLPFYAGQVKCIYIDPPYNTGQVFDHYDDNLEHSLWLSTIYPRLELLRDLLAEGGFFCCQIDDTQAAYIKVLLDEVFGRKNHVTTFYMQVRYANKTLAEDADYQKVIEQCLIYSSNAKVAKAVKEKQAYRVDKFEWAIDEKVPGEEFEVGGKKVILFRPGQYKIRKIEASITGLKETWATGSLVRQSGSSGEFLDKNLATRKTVDGLNCLYKVFGIGEDGLGYRYMTGPKKATATKGKFYSGIPLQTLEKLDAGDADKEVPIQNFYDLAASFGNCRQEGNVDFRGGKKPEVLLETILKHFSRPGDLVLDSFLGSGTTAAVAQKMGRRYIGIEMGDHAITHCQPRLQKVVDGEQGGISKAQDWQGGGGFRFFKLGAAVFDDTGGLQPDIRFPTLAAHIWFSEMNQPWNKPDTATPFLGALGGRGIALLYNGILGDKSVNGGNVLNRQTLRVIRDAAGAFDGPMTIYGERTVLSDASLDAENIAFKQTPYDVRARK